MTPDEHGGGRRGARAAAALAAVLALGAAGTVAAGAAADSGPPAPPRSAEAPPGSLSAPQPDGAPEGGGPVPPPATPLDVPVLPFAEPVGLAVPAIGVSRTSFVPLSRDGNGELEVPEDYDQPGWYVDGPAPGQFGPAVIAGHVDSTRGPAVFYRLGELQPGDTVEVARADGTTARFAVYRVDRYPKDAFPTADVYGDTTQRSELRLITCGGDFDDGTGHYLDNVVVYASLV